MRYPTTPLMLVMLVLVTVQMGQAACATTLIIENAQQSQSQALPTRGMLKDQVERQFGVPSERIAATGHPPISRWVYPSFTVYFEYDHVITSVHHHRKP